MGKYLKMGNVFSGRCEAGAFAELELYCENDFVAEFDVGICAEYAAHAINSHDELVQMNQELLAALEQCYEKEWGYGTGPTHDELVALIAKAKDW